MRGYKDRLLFLQLNKKQKTLGYISKLLYGNKFSIYAEEEDDE